MILIFQFKIFEFFGREFESVLGLLKKSKSIVSFFTLFTIADL